MHRLLSDGIRTSGPPKDDPRGLLPPLTPVVAGVTGGVLPQPTGLLARPRS